MEYALCWTQEPGTSTACDRVVGHGGECTWQLAARASDLDVGTVVARLEQIDREGAPTHWLWDRVMTCDVPRLRQSLSAQTRRVLAEMVSRP